MSHPAVSVIVTTYNSENYINQCLRSITNSSLKKYELIIVDDGSTDNSVSIAKKYTPNILTNHNNQGKTYSRMKAIRKAKSEIIVNIDSDVIIKKHTLSKICAFFTNNPDTEAITGILEPTVFTDFSTSYKNIYMNYHFMLLPSNITFLYGSIFGIRKSIILKIPFEQIDNITEDTSLGQQLIKSGYSIVLKKSILVKHIKNYNLFSLLKNDFNVAKSWSHVFWKYNGPKQLGRDKTGFAHASKSQIISLLLMPVILSSFIWSVLTSNFLVPVFLIIIWFILNTGFFKFIYKKTSILFTLKSIAFTFIDHIVMISGVVSGSIYYTYKKIIMKNNNYHLDSILKKAKLD